MTSPTIARMRLAANGLDRPRFDKPETVVGWFGAFQGQDYGPSSWGIGQRLAPGATQEDIDAALASGRILRTHAMRPTWHFLRPDDIRWVLQLTSHRVHRLNALYYRRLELDAATLARGTDAIVRALDGGRFLTRRELAAVLERAGVVAAGQRLAYLIMHAELEGIVVSGPRRGAQFTYALMDDRVPARPGRDRSSALAELTRRYFTSHGPAEPRDFAWWSGLTTADAREGLALAGDALVRERIDGRDWWFSPDAVAPATPFSAGPLLHLLPGLDEYALSMRDRGPILDPAIRSLLAADEASYMHTIARDGVLVGGWRREPDGLGVVVQMDLRVALDASEQATLDRAVGAYGQFLGTTARAEPWNIDTRAER